jgi:hypothetical protein
MFRLLFDLLSLMPPSLFQARNSRRPLILRHDMSRPETIRAAPPEMPRISASSLFSQANGDEAREKTNLEESLFLETEFGDANQVSGQTDIHRQTDGLTLN